MISEADKRDIARMVVSELTQVLEERLNIKYTEDLISTDELALRLGISRRTIYRMLDTIPHVHVGDHYRFNYVEVVRAINGQKR